MNNNITRSLRNLVSYTHASTLLKDRFSLSDRNCRIPELDMDIKILPFHSTFRTSLPEGNEYQGMNSVFRALLEYYLQQNTYSNEYIFNKMETSDENVSENNDFNYLLFLPDTIHRADSVIFLFHGLNERFWNKYLVWAYSLAASLNTAVILFPIAFHMNRAPADWANPRLMNTISRERQTLFPGVRCASFANAAISSRLQTAPARFCYSGLQTMHDITSLVREIRNGGQEYINPNAGIDLFGYSIGGFLGEMFLLANPDNQFDDSKLVMFCGGASLDLTNPVSKAILDSEAMHAIAEFFGPGFQGNVAADNRLRQTLELYKKEAEAFSVLANSHMNPQKRKSLFASMQNRIKSIALSKDTVITSRAVSETLTGGLNTTGPATETLDFAFDYTHENPFPMKTGNHTPVDEAFSKTFEIAIDFLQ